MAAGSAKRCNGEIKQLYEINGEPILHRTVRLIRTVDSEAVIHIVSWAKELQCPGVTFIDTKTPTRCLNVSMLYTADYWGDGNAILTGDAVFTEEALRLIYDNSHIMQCYGRYSDKAHGGPERYALTFSWADSEYIKRRMKLCSNNGLCNEVPCCITQSLLISWLRILNILIRPLNYIVRAETNAGIMGRIYNITFLRDYLSHKAKMVVIDDPRVRDVDTYEELQMMQGLWQ